jgi:hypothetical protein
MSAARAGPPSKLLRNKVRAEPGTVRPNPAEYCIRVKLSACSRRRQTSDMHGGTSDATRR